MTAFNFVGRKVVDLNPAPSLHLLLDLENVGLGSFLLCNCDFELLLGHKSPAVTITKDHFLVHVRVFFDLINSLFEKLNVVVDPFTRG